jgi:Indole-3-glycerol phosphate synthase
MTILEEIVMFKKLEVARRKLEVKTYDLEASPLFKSPPLSLKESLLNPEKTGIIAEYKRKSPSKGVINESADISAVTQAYASFGASGLSILTDEKFFGGTSGDLIKARENPLPILRKDFIVDDYQVIETRSIGANVILLIAACLTPIEVEFLATYAKTLELEVMLEIHDEKELNHICDAVDIVGVNNRDLDTFEVDIQQSLRLAEKIPPGKIRVAESGINTVEDLLLLKENGYQGFLIGDRFMREEDPGKAFGDFVKTLKEKKQ